MNFTRLIPLSAYLKIFVGMKKSSPMSAIVKPAFLSVFNKLFCHEIFRYRVNFIVG
jgi:hypothetical protein